MTGEVDGKQRRRGAAENGSQKGEEVFPPPPSGGGRPDLFPAVRQAFEAGNPEALLRHLHTVERRKESEVEDLCKSHYEEFIASVDELRAILDEAERLNREVSGGNSALQEVGGELLLRADRLIERHTLRRNLVAATRLSGYCVRLLELCGECNRHVTAGRYCSALRTLEIIENSRFGQAAVPSALKLAIEERIPKVKLHVEAKACREFEEWLASMRATSKEVGRAALGRAESVRRRERRALQEAEEEAGGGRLPPPPGLDPGFCPDGGTVNPDLAPLLRAHQAHARLGMREKFGELYGRRRVAQLDSDLQVSDGRPFLDYYRPLVDGIAGHFIIESRVSRAAEGLLAEGPARTMWETASRKLKTVLQDQLARVESPVHVAAVRDRVGLLGSALRPYGYDVGPVLGALADARERYHGLLLEDCRRILSEVVAADGRERAVFGSEAEYDAVAGAFGLAAAGGRPAAFPFVAPFSSAVPDMCRVVRSFAEASADYLAEGWDPPGSSEGYLDKLLADVLAGVLLEAARGRRDGGSGAAQTAADVAAMERACGFSFFGAGPAAAAEARRALGTAVEAAVRTLIDATNARLDEMMSAAESVTSAEDDVAGSESAAYVDGLMASVREILPEEAVREVGDGVFGHVSDIFVAVFAGEGVKRFNMGAVGRVDRDLGRMEALAEGRPGGPGTGFGRRLEEARQLVNLLGSDRPEGFADRAERERSYAALDPRMVAAVCDKYRDSAEGIFGSLGARQSTRKRSMELLKRRLKESGLVT